MSGDPSGPSAARSRAALGAHATRQRRKRERLAQAAADARATRERERSEGGLDPTGPVEAAVIRVARSAQARARRYGLDYERDLPRLMLDLCRRRGGRCSESGVPFSMDALGHGAAPRALAPSIDRVDSARGFTIDNVRLIAWALNSFFGVWGRDVALKLARGLVERASEATPGP